MQTWNCHNFHKQEKVLDIYLNNVEQAMILLEINDIHGVKYYTEKLLQTYQIHSINMFEYRSDFNLLISDILEKDLRNICFYGFYEKDMQFDLLKSLNMTRDVFANRGIIIFMMPSIMVENIRLQLPNFYDYIYLRTDFLENYQRPFDVIFSWNGNEFVDRETLNKRKQMLIYSKNNMQSKSGNNSNSIIEKINEDTIKQYYYDLQMFGFKKMSSNDINDCYQQLEAIISQIRKMITMQEAGSAMLDELVLSTARLFLKNNAFEEARKLYVLRLGLSNNNDVRLMESMQEMAYLYYQQGNFAKAIELLDEMLSRVEVMNNLPWKCKIYNNYATCLYKRGRYEEALGILEESLLLLQKSSNCNLNREYRITYNMILIELELQKNLCDTLNKALVLIEKMDKNSYEYLRLAILTAWIQGVEAGNLKEGYQLIQHAYCLAQKILPENHMEFVVMYYVKAILESHMEKDEESMVTIARAKKVLVNHDTNSRGLAAELAKMVYSE